MASPSEFGLAIEVTDGPKTLFCLKQKQTGLQKQKHTYFYLSFVCCMNVRCRVSMSSIFASTFASFMLKVKKKKKKKKKSRPTDPPSEKWLVDNQTIYFFWPKVCFKQFFIDSNTFCSSLKGSSFQSQGAAIANVTHHIKTGQLLVERISRYYSIWMGKNKEN